MTDLDESIREGHYAKKQILSRDWLISWSHRRRYSTGLKLAQRFAGQSVLDYGCGDGTFLALLMSTPGAPQTAVGAEIDAHLVDDCRSRLGNRSGLSFVTSDELKEAGHEHRYDAVVCMEVLEHALDPESLLQLFDRLLRPGGRLLVSVPVETGLPVLVKQSARRIAGWRGIGDYPGTTPYRWPELARSLFAGRRQHIERPLLKSDDGRQWYDHKGFNWMALRERLRQRFVIEETMSSPVSWLTPHLASQAWFLATKPQSKS